MVPLSCIERAHTRSANKSAVGPRSSIERCHTRHLGQGYSAEDASNALHAGSTRAERARFIRNVEEYHQIGSANARRIDGTGFDRVCVMLETACGVTNHQQPGTSNQQPIDAPQQTPLRRDAGETLGGTSRRGARSALGTHPRRLCVPRMGSARIAVLRLRASHDERRNRTHLPVGRLPHHVRRHLVHAAAHVPKGRGTRRLVSGASYFSGFAGVALPPATTNFHAPSRCRCHTVRYFPKR